MFNAKTALLYREIKETHQIEGVHSSRREIEESAAVFPTQRRRFSEFFMVLAELFSASEPQEVASLEDIRRLYDRITAGENSELHLEAVALEFTDPQSGQFIKIDLRDIDVERENYENQ